VVIVGGGAAGLPLATRLGDTLGRRGQATITLVDHNASHLWKPLLHEVAAGRVDADLHDVDYFLMAYWRAARIEARRRARRRRRGNAAGTHGSI
jgi:NADH:ubiquinone reductase (H+-translocating)